MTRTDSPQTTPFWVIVPAAGAGKRMGASVPKQYLSLMGKPLLAHTLENILEWPGLLGVVVAIADGDTAFAGLPVAADPRVHTVTGGTERADSVLAALDFLTERAAADTCVLVHDAARPLVSVEDIRQLVSPETSTMALLAQPASDTVKQASVKEGRAVVEKTLPRTEVWLAQTPQKAPLALLHRCLQQGLAQNPAAITDEASALELAGYAPQLIPACRSNFKVTHPSDLPLAEALLQHRQRAVGDSPGNSQ